MDRIFVGKSFARPDGAVQATGEARFVDDLRFERLLHGKVLRAAHPHARILNLDTGPAERLAGVAGVLTHQDIPNNRCGFTFLDQPVLASDRVRYLGDAVAAVAAESPEIAEEAVRLIRVEYEVLPAVFDPEEAMRPGAPILHEGHRWERNICFHRKVRKGDVARGFEESDLLVEGDYSTQWNEHAAIEPHICAAQPEPGGKLVIWASTQRPFLWRSDLCRVLNLSMSKVRVIPVYCGGGFGGKHEIVVEPFAALFALRTGRPVKFRYTREEEFVASTVRHPYRIRYKTGVKQDGRVLARQARIVSDSGPYCSWGESALTKAAIHAVGPYRVPNVRVDAYLVYTNNPLTGAVRGFGVPQVSFAHEVHTEEMCHRLGMDPLAFRKLNAVRTGDVYTTGVRLESVGLLETLERAAAAVGWEHPPANGRSANGRLRRGVGIASMIYPVGFTSFLNPSAAFLRVNEDGSGTLWTGCADTGQGAHRILAQIAAEETGVHPDRMVVIGGDTELTPFDCGAVASRTTHIGGNAVKAAGRRVRDQILSAAAELMEASPRDLAIGKERVEVVGSPDRAASLKEIAAFSHKRGRTMQAEGAYSPDLTPLDEETGQGRPYDCWVFATHAAEVEVDVETGEFRVLKLVCAHDAGTAVNPLELEGQIQGGSLQGVGYGTMEEIFCRDGRVENPDFAGYLLPTSLDSPEEHRSEAVETYEPTGPYGAKGVAEPVLNPTAPAICNAIYHAVGVRLTELPVTAEKILAHFRRKGA
ncbi:MAG: xanthine dehydrogenase family protein molybdopterin-binding subunit [Nitrospinota bacterium]